MIRIALAALALTASGVAAMNAASAPRAQSQPASALPEVLTRAIASYSTLTSYADIGTMRLELGFRTEEARFTTYFRRASRDFYFDYQPLWDKQGPMTWDLTKQRTVVWMFKGEMQKYDQGAKTSHEVINAEGGGQVRALSSTAYATKGASIMIPSLLYSQAKLPSAVLQLEEAEVAGVEEINKRRCHKITGVAAAYYPSGQRTSVRPVTVWIDVETQLIRRVFEDTPPGYGGGRGILRYTFTFEPQANPTIDDSKFQFKVPAPSSK